MLFRIGKGFHFTLVYCLTLLSFPDELNSMVLVIFYDRLSNHSNGISAAVDSPPITAPALSNYLRRCFLSRTDRKLISKLCTQPFFPLLQSPNPLLQPQSNYLIHSCVCPRSLHLPYEWQYPIYSHVCFLCFLCCGFVFFGLFLLWRGFVLC